MLADSTAEEIRYRLDRLYLEAIQSNGQGTNAKVEDDALVALEEELESLYPEIEILAEISTKQQFYEPILREIHNEHSQLRADSQQKLEHVGYSSACAPGYTVLINLTDTGHPN